jgi:hypothetical protein
VDDLGERHNVPCVATFSVTHAIVVAAGALGCKARAEASAKPVASAEPTDARPTPLVERATAICRRQEAAGVAKNCTPPVRMPRGASFRVQFDPTADAPGEGAVKVFFSDRDARDEEGIGLTAPNDAAQPDDYPSLYVSSPPGVTSGPWRIQWATARWVACREKKTVAVCAEQYPAEYESARKILAVASRLARQ